MPSLSMCDGYCACGLLCGCDVGTTTSSMILCLVATVLLPTLERMPYLLGQTLTQLTGSTPLELLVTACMGALTIRFVCVCVCGWVGRWVAVGDGIIHIHHILYKLPLSLLPLPLPHTHKHTHTHTHTTPPTTSGDQFSTDGQRVHSGVCGYQWPHPPSAASVPMEYLRLLPASRTPRQVGL